MIFYEKQFSLEEKYWHFILITEIERLLRNKLDYQLGNPLSRSKANQIRKMIPFFKPYNLFEIKRFFEFIINFRNRLVHLEYKDLKIDFPLKYYNYERREIRLEDVYILCHSFLTDNGNYKQLSFFREKFNFFEEIEQSKFIYDEEAKIYLKRLLLDSEKFLKPLFYLSMRNELKGELLEARNYFFHGYAYPERNKASKKAISFEGLEEKIKMDI